MVTSASGGPQVVALNGTGLDFSFTGITTALTVSPGAQAQFHLTVLPGGMQTTLNFSCTGAPAQSSCQVSSATATLDGVTPASLTVSVQTTAPSAALPRMPQLPRGGAQGEIPKTLFLLTLLALTGVAFTDSRRRVAWTFAVLTLSALLLSGCDAGGQANSGTHALTPGTPAGTYTLTVSATSPTMSHSTNLTLTVQN
jgi:hypothetical protein